MTLTQITEKGIKDGEIVNADINASAAIAGSKISPSFTSSLSVSVGSSGTNASVGFDELTIEGGNEDIGMCFISPAANERTHTIAFGDSNNNNAGKIQYNHSTDDLTLTASDNIILTGDAVGINTGATAPAEKLTLGDGDLKFFHSNAGSAHRTTFIEFGNSSNRITSEMNYGPDSSSNYAAGLKFTTKNFNGTSFETINALNIKANGNVGLGITSPAFKFESNGGADNSVCFAGRSDGGNGNNARFTLKGYSHGGGADYGGGFKIQTRDTVNVFHDRLTIDSSGKVGIGTTNPATLLQLSRSSTTAYNATSTTDDSTLYVLNSGANGQATIQLQTLSGGTANTGQATISAFCEGDSSKSTALTFATRDNSGNAPREKLRITSEKKLILGLNDNIPATMEVRYSTVPTYLTSTFDGTYGEATLSVNAPRTSDGSGSWGNAGNGGYGIGALQVLSHSSTGSVVKVLTSNQDNTVPTEKLTVYGGGNVGIINGDLEFASGHGINFSATSDGSGTDSSELLDDYEEGTFSPYSPSLTLSYATGHYVKIGRYVMASIRVGIPSNSNANNFVLDGLPYNSRAYSGTYHNGGYLMYSGGSSYGEAAGVLVYDNSDRLQMYNKSGGNILLTNLDGVQLRIQVHYFTD